jgi:hypothetical protein
MRDTVQHTRLDKLSYQGSSLYVRRSRAAGSRAEARRSRLNCSSARLFSASSPLPEFWPLFAAPDCCSWFRRAARMAASSSGSDIVLRSNRGSERGKAGTTPHCRVVSTNNCSHSHSHFDLLTDALLQCPLLNSIRPFPLPYFMRVHHFKQSLPSSQACRTRTGAMKRFDLFVLFFFLQN